MKNRIEFGPIGTGLGWIGKLRDYVLWVRGCSGRGEIEKLRDINFELDIQTSRLCILDTGFRATNFDWLKNEQESAKCLICFMFPMFQNQRECSNVSL